MKLIKFCTLAVLIITMTGCVKRYKSEMQIICLKPQAVIENQTNSFRLSLDVKNPEEDHYIDVDVPALDRNQVEFVAIRNAAVSI